MLRDSGLLMFLLLLLLDVPFPAIGKAYVRVTGDFALQSKEISVNNTPVDDSRAANREHWAGELSRRLIVRYGSTSAYFDLVGVSVATRTEIKDILLISEEKESTDIT
jgi:hypothetical protein